jgi:predicted DNA binding CopG/RHH family protein
MLRDMTDGYEAALSRDAASFASFLAGLAEPEQVGPCAESLDRWDCDGLAEDVATISGAKPPIEREAAVPVKEAAQVAKSAQETTGMAKRKSASVTIRMTQEECDQLQQRAVAAGLTVSAYLRSCTFEAEALRAQVKAALAQFSAAAVAVPERKGTASAGMGDARETSQGDLRVEMRRGLRARIFSRWTGHGGAMPA